jgi:hypothetical protein
MRFLFVAALGSASLFALACGSTVINDDDGTGGGGGSDCGPPPPQSGDGWCPTSYECIDGQWHDTPGVCPEPECPASEPYDSVACVLEGQDCQYEVEWGCDEEYSEVTYTCMDGVWVEISNYCQPPPKCPDALPVDGSDCAGWDYAYDCSYQVPNACGIEDDYAYVYCDGTSWTVDMKSTCGECSYEDAASCEANAACRWLVPGCGDNPLPAEGCAPIDDCAPDSCTGGATCSTYDANPCWNSPCDACSAPVSICEMIFEPNE